MDPELIGYIVSVVLALVSTFFGVKYTKVRKALKESKEAVVVIVDAIEDDKIDAEETKAITKEVKEAAAAWGAVFKKPPNGHVYQA